MNLEALLGVLPDSAKTREQLLDDNASLRLQFNYVRLRTAAWLFCGLQNSAHTEVL